MDTQTNFGKTLQNLLNVLAVSQKLKVERSCYKPTFPSFQANLAPPPTASVPTATSSTDQSDALAGSSNDVDVAPDVEAVRANLDAVMDGLKSGSDVRKRVETLLTTKWAAMDPAVKSGVCQLASRLSAGTEKHRNNGHLNL